MTPAPLLPAFVSVAIDRDTAQFAVAAIGAWWDELGHQHHLIASSLTITADCKGPNDTAPVSAADRTGAEIAVDFAPPGPLSGPPFA